MPSYRESHIELAGGFLCPRTRVGVLSLTVQIKDLDKWIQIWYADDANNCGKLPLLREWFLTCSLPRAQISVTSRSHQRVSLWWHSAISRRQNDCSVTLASKSARQAGFLEGMWDRQQAGRSKLTFSRKFSPGCTTLIAEAAGSQPQDAYAAHTKSLSFEWTFVQRVVQEGGDLFEPVEEMICNKFLPQLLGSEFTPEDRAVFALPVKFAGLGIPNPTATAKNAFRTSKRPASHLTDAISGQGEMDHITHGQVVMEARTEHRGSRRQEHAANLNSTLANFADDKQRIVRRAADHPIGAWLSVLPCAKHNAVLSPWEIRDGLCMRYQLPSNTCTTDAMVVEHVSRLITD